MNLEVIILAAGKGTRMRSALPKVLHRLAGRPLLGHVCDTASRLQASRRHVVVGHLAEQVKAAFPDDDLCWVEQTEQLGTGHAVQQAAPGVAADSVVLILYGDVPLTRHETLHHLVDLVDERHMALLTVTLDEAGGYGRIVRDAAGDICSIVEHKDADAEQLAIREVNSGIMALQAKHLQAWLPQLSNDNAQGEYYLTDLISLAVSNGVTVRSAQPDAMQEVEGVNDRLQLAALERWFQQHQAEQHMRNGVTLLDPARVDFRGDVQIGSDSVVDVNVIFSGRIRVGANVQIGPGCHLHDCEIKDGARILEHCVIENAVVGTECMVGPFARLRPGTDLSEGAKVGNFVETKNARVGAGSKINHLSYVGDTALGRDVNIGAGTITCNYDGANKHQTSIGDNAFVGSNSSLVAPLSIGAGATIGAGSTVSRDVPDNALAVARGKQREIAGWQRPTKKKDQ